MTKQSERVKDWRRRTRIRVVEMMGGECQGCGYNKCMSALECHHIIPEEKDFRIASFIANPKGWDKILKELRKCILLCANCHREVHNNMRDISSLLCPIIEELTDYKQIIADTKKQICPVCKDLKQFKGITCSVSCGAKHKHKIDWENSGVLELREQGYSYNKIGNMLGCSGVTVKKHVQRLMVP